MVGLLGSFRMGLITKKTKHMIRGLGLQLSKLLGGEGGWILSSITWSVV